MAPWQERLAECAADPQTHERIRTRLETFRHNLEAIAQQPLPQPQMSGALKSKLKPADVMEIAKYVNECVSHRQAAIVEFVTTDFYQAVFQYEDLLRRMRKASTN